MKSDKPKKVAPRNGYALAAKMRHGGVMKHRLEPKKGATNEQRELLKEAPTKCFDCDLPAVWVRYTQFAGDHYFCQAHAEREKDFSDKSLWDKLNDDSNA
jgi:hypothetical protein